MTRIEALEKLNESITKTEEARIKNAIAQAKYENISRQLDTACKFLFVTAMPIV